MSTVKKCLQCQKDYTKKSKQAYLQFEASQFCSKSCKGVAQGFKSKEQLTKNCTICGVLYPKPINQNLAWWKKSKFCSQTCYQIEASIFMGTFNYRGKENKYWKLAVLERDNRRCRMSNGDCSVKLEVHHILRYSEFPELRYDINNGITLCSFHHPRKKVEEKRLEATFKSFIWQQ